MIITQNATAKMMQKLRMRWEHLEDTRRETGNTLTALEKLLK